jgi:hypothetical protein
MASTTEHERLQETRESNVPWRKWGPYLSERQWGTVREDYSDNGDAWNYFTHDQARSRAYRWGEDGLAGICDDHQVLCFALALWNGKDPILKERLFGLTNSEGNHGEAVESRRLIDSGVYTFARTVMYRITNVYAIKMAGVFMISLGTMWVRTRVMPRWLALLTYALALGLLVSISSNLWMTLIFPGWVCVVSLYILISNLRGPSASLQGSADSSKPPNCGP